MTNEKLKVYVERHEHEYEQMFENNGYEVVKDLGDADIICFTGGSDVQPVMYGHDKHYTTQDNPKRDDDCQMIYGSAKKGAFFVGICRGGQFLNVMNGGVMYQHVDNHCISHKATNLLTGEELHVSSTHHQMMYPPAHGQVVMEGDKRNTRGVVYAPELGGFVTLEIQQDVEAVWFEDTRCFCFQPHPEYNGYDECCRVFFQMLEELINR